MSRIFSQPLVRYMASLVTIFVAYLLTAQLGLSIHPTDSYATLVWAPSGIALALLTLWGLDLWPGVAIAAFFVNAGLGAAVPEALAIAAGNTMAAFVGAYLLRNYFKLNPMFFTLKDSFSFLFTACVVNVISSAVGTATLALSGSIPPVEIINVWTSWYIGDTVGMLVVGAFLLRWLYRPVFTKTYAEIIEGCAIFGFLIVVTALIFWTPVSQLGNLPLIYVLFIPLIWAALRSGPRGMTLGILLTAIVSVASIVSGHLGFVAFARSEGLLLLDLLLGTLSIVFLLFVSIVEERKEAVVQLREHVKKIEEALQQIRVQDEAKNEFIATLAHELRNPLSPIVSSLELLETHTLPAASATLVEIMQTHIQTLSRLLDDLLDVSRITTRKFALQKERVRLETVVTRSVQTVETLVKLRKHALLVRLPTHTVWLEVDAVRLEQALVNLLNNAAKYTEPGGRIELAARHDGNQLIIRIKDNGIGIESDMLTHIFAPFARGARATRRPQGGLGIGLSLTKELIELHGGTIEAHSSGLDRGSEFVISLPLPSQVPMHTEKPVQAPRPAVSKGHSILIVDDNEAAALSLEQLLKHHGHTTRSVHNGGAALEAAQELRPEVIILDIGLPDMDGYTVAQRLQEQDLRPRVLIALTGYGQIEDKQKAQDAGFDFHLTKPVSLRDVEDVLAHTV